jgi:GNAT superfamily N-acetyltransferase
MVQSLPHDRAEEAVDALCDSFHDYPVMRFILGAALNPAEPAGKDHDARLRALIGMFVAARVARGAPILAVERDGLVAGVATLTRPGEPIAPPSTNPQREATWAALGADARARYELLVEAWEERSIPEPQYHLNMIGVRRSHAGQGLGRHLLDAVHEMSERDAVSAGVSLTTEDPKNVALYQHFGYEVVAHDLVAGKLETWLFFRRNRPEG